MRLLHSVTAATFGLGVALTFACAPSARSQTSAPAIMLVGAGSSLLPAPIVIVAPLLGATTKAAKQGPLSLIPKPFTVSLRLGAMISPRTKFMGGVDVAFGFGLLPSLSTRVDAEAIVSANLGGISTLIPLTVDQVYSKGLVAGTRVYIGAGVGPYIGDVTRFGGKVFVGADLARSIGAEAAVHFAGTGDPLLTLEARFPL